jgi:hypothetical protein
VVLVPGNAVAGPADFTAAVTGLMRVAIAQGAAVISISGSEGERLFTGAEVARVHAAVRQAADRRVTVVASSGAATASGSPGPPTRTAFPASARPGAGPTSPPMPTRPRPWR